MMETITEQALHDDCDGVMRRVGAGQTFAVTRGGRPVAEIHPAQVGRQRVVSRERLLALAERSAPIDRHRFRADLDAVIDPWFER